MRFIIIDPRERTVRDVECKELRGAVIQSGLEPDRTDHGSFGRDETGHGYGFVVYEFGLFVPKDRQHYFALNRYLVAGTLVQYGYDQMGDTIDAKPLPTPPRWLTGDEAEAEMQAGTLDRPQQSVNGEVLWRWPEPNKIGVTP